MSDPIQLTTPQALALAMVIQSYPLSEPRLDNLGSPGEQGPLLVDVGSTELVIDEDGVVETDPHGVVA